MRWLKTIKQIQTIYLSEGFSESLSIRFSFRKQPFPGQAGHLVASRGQDLEGWGLSPRGAGYLFGGDVVKGSSP